MAVRLTIDPDQINRPINSDEFWKKFNEKIQPVLPKDETCLIEAFFRNEAKKPLAQRERACWISCRCPRCNPHFM